MLSLPTAAVSSIEFLDHLQSLMKAPGKPPAKRLPVSPITPSAPRPQKSESAHLVQSWLTTLNESALEIALNPEPSVPAVVLTTPTSRLSTSSSTSSSSAPSPSLPPSQPATISKHRRGSSTGSAASSRPGSDLMTIDEDRPLSTIPKDPSATSLLDMLDSKIAELTIDIEHSRKTRPTSPPNVATPAGPRSSSLPGGKA
ncbi:hypothetical protein HKX48_004079 [Thoreauomyces humboldtii]|nr:hypothetical protein HKX48_004079 [Thoreauomyces humboldtii]